MANPDYTAILDDLERDLAPIDKQRETIINSINYFRAKAGLPPRPEGGGSGGGGGVAAGGGGVIKIASDQYVGKQLRSATKDYLNMRKSAGLDGPATPREIYDAIIGGGFEFQAKDESTRLISLRNMLRKRTEVFKKFEDTGKYGLNEWYGIKAKPKAADHDDDADDETEADTSDNSAAAKKASA